MRLDPRFPSRCQTPTSSRREVWNDPARHHLAVAAVRKTLPSVARDRGGSHDTRATRSHAARFWRRPAPLERQSPAARCCPQRPQPPAGHAASGAPRSTIWSISCQENRSFDHYFGYAPQVQARRLGPPPGYTQPDAAGVGHAPFELTALRSVDPPHGWDDVHAQYNGGKMDGFFRNAALRTGDGNNAIPYYTAKELPFYYSLFRHAGLCGNYFCSLLGPTWPNRFYLMSGTSGGITTNGLWGYGIFDSTRWPIILDLLDDGRRELEDLLHRLRRGARSATPTTSPCSGAAGRTTRGPRQRSTTISRTAAAGRCRTSPGSSRASRCSSTSTRTRT